MRAGEWALGMSREQGGVGWFTVDRGGYSDSR